MPALDRATELMPPSDVPSGETLMNGQSPGDYFDVDGNELSCDTTYLAGINLINDGITESPMSCNEVFLTPKGCDDVERVHFKRGDKVTGKRKVVIQDVVNADKELDKVVIKNCGKCSWKKVDDQYPQEYFVSKYGNLKCCNDGCKEKQKSMRGLVTKGNGQCMWVCENCEMKDDKHHNCQQMYCNICYFQKQDKESGVGKMRMTRRATV